MQNLPSLHLIVDLGRMRRASCTLAIALILVLASGVARADSVKLRTPGPAERLFKQGLAALSANDLNGAETAFKESLKLQPKAASVMVGLAQVAVLRGDNKAAATYLQQAFAIAPDSAVVQQDWGRLQYSGGKYKEAETAFRTASQIDPHDPRAQIALGDLYLTAFRNPSEAIPFYRQAIAIDPERGGAHYALGLALAATGDEKGAIDSLTLAAEVSPGNPLPYYQLGRLHEARRRADEALDAFNRALKISPSFAPAMFERGNVLLGKNDVDGAIRELNAAAKANAAYADPHLTLGMIYQQRQQWTSAKDSYLTAVKLDPRQAIAYNNLAWMAAERKVDLNDALSWARNAVTIAPNVSQFQTTLGWVQRARGELDAAMKTLAKAAAMKPERADAAYYLGIAQLDAGKRADAAVSLKKAIAIDPAFANAADANQRLKSLGS